jgi:hypothetical protein
LDAGVERVAPRDPRRARLPTAANYLWWPGGAGRRHGRSSPASVCTCPRVRQLTPATVREPDTAGGRSQACAGHHRRLRPVFALATLQHSGRPEEVFALEVTDHDPAAAVRRRGLLPVTGRPSKLYKPINWSPTL